jgi:uncharacterized protein (DUF1501 family)
MTDLRERSIETQLAVMNEMWETHTEQDKEQFELLSVQLGDLDSKLDALLIREATRTGEAAATKRYSGYVSAVVSFLVTIVGLFIGFNVNG